MIALDPTFQRLLSHLARGGDYGYWWTVSEPGAAKTTHWWPVREPAPVPNGVPQHVYFGVHPTVRQRSSYQRARVVDIAAINCVFGEFDEQPGDLPLPPSVTIESSPGKYHLYWLLNEPLRLDTDEARKYAQWLQASWVGAIKADPKSKDLARVLRVPGTQNLKPDYGPDFPTVRVVSATGETYSLPQIEAVVGERPQPQTVDTRPKERVDLPMASGYYWLSRALEKAPSGRNDAGFWLACQLRDAGLTQSEAEGFMREFQQQTSGGSHPYTLAEARSSLKQAYERPAREPVTRQRQPDASSAWRQANEDWEEGESQPAMPGKPIDFHDLMALPRQPIRWFAPGFFREGLGILAGEPNVGKTPLIIQLAIALARGDAWIGKVQCAPAKVLFIGTEYTRGELASVLEGSIAGRKPPPGALAFKCLDDGDEISPETPADALRLLEYYFSVEGYDVIMIDVLTGFLPSEGFKQNVYRGDYKEFKPYHVLALSYHGLILGTWHSTKRETNPRHMFNGSNGFWGVPASRVTLYTDADNRVRIFSMPRFEPKTDWALAIEQTIAGKRWIVSDAAPEPIMNDTERQIYRWLQANASRHDAKGPAVIAGMINIKESTVKGTLRRMYEKNLVQQTIGGSGYYVERSDPDEEDVVTDVTETTAVTSVTDVTNSVNPTKNGYTCNRRVTVDLARPDAPNSPGYKSYNNTGYTDDGNKIEGTQNERLYKLAPRLYAVGWRIELIGGANGHYQLTAPDGTQTTHDNFVVAINHASKELGQ